jgi:hypothetical protein
MDLSKLREMAPRPFAVVHEIPADDEGPEDLAVAGWGLQMNDRTFFAWSDTETGDRSSVGVFTSAERVLWMVEMIAPARLVWMEPTEPGA